MKDQQASGGGDSVSRCYEASRSHTAPRRIITTRTTRRCRPDRISIRTVIRNRAACDVGAQSGGFRARGGIPVWPGRPRRPVGRSNRHVAAETCRRCCSVCRVCAFRARRTRGNRRHPPTIVGPARLYGDSFVAARYCAWERSDWLVHGGAARSAHWMVVIDHPVHAPDGIVVIVTKTTRAL
jgi:hypothetical protein